MIQLKKPFPLACDGWESQIFVGSNDFINTQKRRNDFSFVDIEYLS